MNEKELIIFFKKANYDSVVSSKIIKDSFSGKSKGFGYLYLLNYNEYHQLLNLNSPIVLKGKNLKIK